MRALPDDGWNARSSGSMQTPSPGIWKSAGVVRHTFTHFSLELAVLTSLGASRPDGQGEWWPIDSLDEAGLPTLFAKAARLAQSG
jgi:A/G-specific adenine glycosylase